MKTHSIQDKSMLKELTAIRINHPALAWGGFSTILFLILLGGLLSYSAISDYYRIDQDAREDVIHNAQIIQKDISFQFDSIYSTLNDIRSDPSYWTQNIGLPSARLSTIIKAMPSIRTINILDTKGNVLTTGRPELIGSNFGNRPYFIDASTLNSDNVMVVSAPFTTSLGVWGINVAMKITEASRGDASVISATINPQYMKILLDAALHTKGMWSSIVHWDGIRYMTAPETRGGGGLNVTSKGTLFSLYKDTGTPDAVVTGVSATSGLEVIAGATRLQTHEAVLNKPLIIFVGRNKDVIFQPWINDLIIKGGLYLVLVFFSAFSLTVAYKRQRSMDNERIKYTHELIESRKSAEYSNKAKSHFLATMSHEVRTPVTSVIGIVDLLGRTKLDNEQRGYISTLRESAGALLSILNDMLDLSKIEAGKIKIENICFSLRSCVHGLYELCQGNATNKGLSLDISGLDAIPDYVLGDPVRIKQIIHNILSNAIKFTEQGGVSIILSTTNNDGKAASVKIEVRDTGIGMTADQVSRLFKPFTQADDSTTRKFGGTGLGLAITKQLVELLGGSIQVESTFGGGTCFRVILTFRLAQDIGQDTKNQVHDSTDAKIITPLTIMVAEDNFINQRLIRTMLEKMGHSVRLAKNGLEAVRLYEAETVDVILMDMQMPEMDGEEATRAIRAMASPKSMVPIIALTADVMTEHRARYVAAGVDDVVAKPIDWDGSRVIRCWSVV